MASAPAAANPPYEARTVPGTCLVGEIEDGDVKQLHARIYAEAGITRSLYGIIVTGPVKADVQIAARSALGDDYSQPEHIVTGPKHAPLPRARNPVNLTMLEGYLTALAVDAAPDEVASADRFTTRPKPGAIKYGATFTFHDGSAIFMYINE